MYSDGIYKYINTENRYILPTRVHYNSAHKHMLPFFNHLVKLLWQVSIYTSEQC